MLTDYDRVPWLSAPGLANPVAAATQPKAKAKIIFDKRCISKISSEIDCKLAASNQTRPLSEREGPVVLRRIPKKPDGELSQLVIRWPAQ
jgi:hypothetical protein